MDAWLSAVSGFVWGPTFLIPMLVGTGVFLTIVLRGLQFRELFPALWFALVKRREADAEGDISHFQALMTALAATVGTGNIAGVATAIAAGGPGALFWMWITGLVGMATKYAEALLSVHFREPHQDGSMRGGPMYYLAKGLPSGSFGKLLGVAFAVFAAVAAFGIGNGVQSVEVGKALRASFGVEPWITQLVLAGLVGVVILGGIRWIGRAASVLVPVMVLFYMGAGSVILVRNAAWIPGALEAVLRGAFEPSAFGGGLLGASVAAALRFGISRGVFSNESGLGSAGIAAAAAATREPVRQALVSMTQTFLDTLVVCTVTGLVILTSVARDADRVSGLTDTQFEAAAAELQCSGWGLDPFAEDFETRAGQIVPHGDEAAPLARWHLLKGAEWTTLAFRDGIRGGDLVVSLAIALFAFTTILGWSYYGETSVEYLAGPRAILPYRTLFAGMVVVGPLLFSDSVWLFSDIANGLMALPNLIGLLLLWKLIVSLTHAYFAKEGDPT